MAASVDPQQLLQPAEYDPSTYEHVAERRIPKPALGLAEYDPNWPEAYKDHEARIYNALRDEVVQVAHDGSTSIHGCPAKPIIDIDLVVRNVSDESTYISQLEKAGYLLLFRQTGKEPHRFLVNDREDVYPVHIHVWAQGSIEVERHRVFREWLRKTSADKDLYAETKRIAAAETNAKGETTHAYNVRKQAVIREISGRAYRDAGHTIDS